MSHKLIIKEHWCQWCGRRFSSWIRVQHHQAAEHAPRTLRDIRTTRDIIHGMRGGSH
ncbi:MAG: hypothetical protein HYX88_01515 [Chloroflexi bacterium]|nr:hypothetical protein [Chloroflexota bacterium]